MRRRRWARGLFAPLVMVVLSLGVNASVARAEGGGEAPTAHGASHRPVGHAPGWRFDLATYIWAPAVNGSVTVDAERIPIDADVADIVKDADSLFAFNLLFLAKKGRWALLVTPQYMKVGADSKDPLTLKVAARIVMR